MIAFILSLVISFIALPMLMEMLKRTNIVCENFEFSLIPSSLGILFVFVQLLTLGILKMVFRFNYDFYLLYIMGNTFIGFLGLLDDLVGEKHIKGLRGHIKAFFNGVLTTGALKAFFGIFISLFISSYFSNNIGHIFINALLISLFVNFMNLFDLRPGRASKVFILISIGFILVNITSLNNYIIYSFWGILIPYMMLDLKSKAMMGDVGSNVLGFTLGFYALISFTFEVKIIILIILIFLQVAAEKFSFSKIIEGNKILRFLDNLGR